MSINALLFLMLSMKLSIVSPVYQAETIIPFLVKRIEQSVQNITPDYEIILVEDRSQYYSWEVIEQISNGNIATLNFFSIVFNWK